MAESTPAPAKDVTAPESQLLALSVADLRVGFGPRGALVPTVRGVTLEVKAGERVGLVGESGSGKSVTAMSVTRLIEQRGGVIDPASRIEIAGNDVMAAGGEQLRAYRKSLVRMIFQDPLQSLNPGFTIGYQMAEALPPGTADPVGRIVELLDRVGIPRAAERVRAYPHELSGGMRQRVMVAMALAASPPLIVADEPTSSLDVRVQAQVLELLDEVISGSGTAMLTITHDLGVAAGFTDRLYVMYAGRIVEHGPTEEILTHPRHPYTSALVSSAPRIDNPSGTRAVSIRGRSPRPGNVPSGCAFHDRCAHSDGGRCTRDEPELVRADAAWAACHYAGATVLPNGPAVAAAVSAAGARPQRAPAAGGAPLLEVVELTKAYRARGRHGAAVPPAVDAVSFHVNAGETFGLVGGSGSGKSTIVRCIAALQHSTSGAIRFNGEDVSSLRGRRLRSWRRHVQVVFQDPQSTLDQRQKIRSILAEPLRIHGMWEGAASAGKISALLERVGLEARDGERYPREFSGGQLQRIAIARALTLEPALVICDEPVSALDVSVRASILNLLRDIQDGLGISYIFVAHDLAVVRSLCHRVGVLAEGRLVEVGDADALFTDPQHDYTRLLLNASPVPDPRQERARRARFKALTAGSAA